MEFVGLLIVIISMIASIVDSQNKKKQKNSGRRGQQPDWKKLFQENPSKLEKKPQPVKVPDIKQVVETIEVKSTAKPMQLVQQVIDGTSDYVDLNLQEGDESLKPVKVSVELAAKQQEEHLDEYTDATFLRKAIIAKEIIDKPRAINPWQRR
ncbi:MAG: hypothetical protein PHI65_06915 [Firmicutes bacterium]|nr:hypothetical protein [Bacillota bacterium]